MGAKYGQLIEFSNKLKMLNDTQREQFIQGCVKEIAARLLALVIHATPVHEEKYPDGSVGGTLRRGWTGGKNINGANYAQNLSVRRKGNLYVIDIINPVEYASYVEYGHRTRNHKGWVKGKFMMTISVQEVEQMTPQILERRLNNMLKEIME